MKKLLFTQSKGKECKGIGCPLLSEKPTEEGTIFICQTNQAIIANKRPNSNIVRHSILPMYKSQIPEGDCPMEYIKRFYS